MNSITRKTDIDENGRNALYENAINQYIDKLDQLNQKLQNYRTQVEIKTNDVTIPERARYNSEQLQDILDCATEYYLTTRQQLVQGDCAPDLMQSRYNTYADTLKDLNLAFSVYQEEMKLNLVDIAFEAWEENDYWNPDVILCNASTDHKIKFISPESMLFWIDFLDSNSKLGSYKVSVIGHRAKVVNDDKVNAIFFREVPSVLWLDPDEQEYEDIDNLSYIRLRLTQGLDNYFQISSQGKSAKDVLDTLVYETTHYNETITLNCLPIYYLEPNHRIRVVDNDSGIRGEYIIKNYSLQLQYDGMMSLTAYKAADKII